MRLHLQIFAAVLVLIATPSLAEDEIKPQAADTDLLALISGKCSVLNVAGRDFACKAVAWAHSTSGRAYSPLRSTIRPTTVTSSLSPERAAGVPIKIFMNCRSTGCF